MSDRRQVWATLADLLAQVRANHQEEVVAPETTLIEKELRKLGKAQFKANALTESQFAQQQTTIEQLSALQTENQALQANIQENQQALINQQMLQAILPALDGLEHAMNSGAIHLNENKALSDYFESLASWLDGLRLVQERLQKVLETGGVTIIPTLGHPFDPFCHKAIGTTTEAGQANLPANTIVHEERRGYRTASGILRFAEVIVYRPQKN